MYQIIFSPKTKSKILYYVDIIIWTFQCGKGDHCVFSQGSIFFFLMVHYFTPCFSEQCTSFPWEQHSMNYQNSCKLRDKTVVESGTKNTKTSPLYLKQSMNERRKNTSRSKRVLWSSRRGSQKNKHGIKNMTRAYETNRKKLFQLIKK